MCKNTRLKLSKRCLSPVCHNHTTYAIGLATVSTRRTVEKLLSITSRNDHDVLARWELWQLYYY